MISEATGEGYTKLMVMVMAKKVKIQMKVMIKGAKTWTTLI